MDKISPQTENIATFKKSTTRRSVIDGKLHSDDSNSDEEYATSGFYVREKSNDKTSDKTIDPSNTLDKVEAPEAEKLKENGVTSDETSHTPIENGKNAEIEDTAKKSNEPLDDPDPNANEKEDDNENEAKIDEKQNKIDNNVSSSSNEPEDNVATSSDVDKVENGVSSTSDNVPSGISKTKAEQNESEHEIEDVDENKKEDLPKIENESPKEEGEKIEDSKEDIKDEHKGALEEASKEEHKGASEEASKEELKDNNPEDKELVEENMNIDKDNKTAPIKEPVKEKEIEPIKVKSDNEEERNKELVMEKEEEVADKSVNKVEEPKDDNSKDKELGNEATKEDIDNKKTPTKEPVLEMKTDPIEVKSDNVEPIKKPVMEEKKESTETKSVADKSDNKAVDVCEPSSSGLQKPKDVVDTAESQDVEMDEEDMGDFDPSMFCPDITMDVDDAPVLQTDENREAAGSPLPYEAIFSTLVDEITGADLQIDLTPVEMEMRKQMFSADNPVQKTKVHCTACNLHLGSALSGANNRFVHPLLKVLICKKCYHFYTSGEFQKDEDGSELYCRWCGQGGHVLCCSSCEYVFCKRCIKNNFGMKKFKEIRESDDWNCFRCDPDQLSILRAACAEFMEYYTRELRRASAIAESQPEVMTTDYTTCCLPPEPKKDVPKTPVVNRSKRKRSDYEADPDYTPIVDDDQQLSKKPALISPASTVTIPVPSLRPIIPKPTIRPIAPAVARPATPRPPVPRPQIPSTGQVFRLQQPNTRFPGSGYSVQKSATQGNNVRNPAFITVPASTKNVANPSFIQIVPTGTRPVQQRPMGAISTANTIRPAAAPPAAATPVRGKTPQRDPPSTMKHEWFEKTVRAAARVNSNLSYTLTQLNRQQSQAGSVEALAMVHNKLQEVLSTSINSLIQIRKNLRTEFIAGIKNIKFPPKLAPPLAAKPIVAAKDDDDVIFVNTTNSGPTQTPLPPLIMSKGVSLTKLNNSNNATSPFSNPKPGPSGAKPASAKAASAKAASAKPASAKPASAKPASIAKKIVTPLPKIGSVSTVSSATPVKGGGFLKVRSFVSLQSVPSECITIPDDPIPPIPEPEDPLKIPDDPLEICNTEYLAPEPEKPRDLEDRQEISSNASTLSASSPVLILDDPEPLVYIVTQKPSREIKRMMGATVIVQKSLEIEKLLMNVENDAVEEIL